jgi:hypothetical protein
MDSLDKIDSQIILQYITDVSISFGDILKQVDNVDMKIVDQYLLKKNTKFPLDKKIQYESNY